MQRLKKAMMPLIANDGHPPAEWRDHALVGNWPDHREYHVGAVISSSSVASLGPVGTRRSWLFGLERTPTCLADLFE